MPSATYVVIGVLPASFSFPMAAEPEFWIAIRGRQPCWDARSCRSLEALARLNDGVSVERASSNMTAVMAQLRAEYPNDHHEPEVAKVVPLRDAMLGSVQPILLMLLGAAGLPWVMATVNGVALVLARSETRRREIAVRYAVGASGGRLTLQFASEALVLAGVSGARALIFASWSVRALR